MSKEIELIKLAWRFADNMSYQHILYGAKHEDMSFQSYVRMRLKEAGVSNSDEEREQIAFYVCEHFDLLD